MNRPFVDQLILIKLLLEQFTQRSRAAGRILRMVLFQCVCKLIILKRPNRKRQAAVLAVETDEFGFNFITNRKYLAGIFNTLFLDIRRTQVTFNAIGQFDHRTAVVHFLDGALDLAAARVLGHEGEELAMPELGFDQWAPVR